jgi:hypothetical protein
MLISLMLIAPGQISEFAFGSFACASETSFSPDLFLFTYTECRNRVPPIREVFKHLSFIHASLVVDALCGNPLGGGSHVGLISTFQDCHVANLIRWWVPDVALTLDFPLTRLSHCAVPTESVQKESLGFAFPGQHISATVGCYK